MRTGEIGRTAIAWSQTELDGLEDAPLALMAVGASWAWRGRGVVLNQSAAIGFDRAVCTNSISLLSDRIRAAAVEYAPTFGATVELCNGAQRFSAQLVWVDGEEMPILIFENGCPERDQDYWVSAVSDLTEAANHIPTVDDTVVAFPASYPSVDVERLPPLILTAAE